MMAPPVCLVLCFNLSQTRRAANRIELKLQQKKGYWRSEPGMVENTNSLSGSKKGFCDLEEMSQTDVMLTAAIEVELEVLRLR